jgi:hypothetical protein
MTPVRSKVKNTFRRNMNIFEILSSGNNGLSEVHVSSMLGWLLDPYHDHGLGIEVLKRLVSAVFEGTPLHKEIIASEYSGVEMKERRRINTSIVLEKEVLTKETNKNRSIDVVVKINNNFILAIENKIRPLSKEHGQASDEISGLINDTEYNISGIKDFYFIYLAKQDSELSYAAKEIENSYGVIAKPFSWLNRNSGALSMSKILQDILDDHVHGRINPIPTETLFILRSFIRFVENGFSYYQLKDKGIFEVCPFMELESIDKSYFIGFQGGLKALENNLIEAENSLEERKRLLYSRQYKIVRNSPNDNWIPLPVFFECFKKHNIFNG